MSIIGKFNASEHQSRVTSIPDQSLFSELTLDLVQGRTPLVLQLRVQTERVHLVWIPPFTPALGIVSDDRHRKRMADREEDGVRIIR